MQHNLNAIEAELCKRSFFYFVQTFWDVIIPETPVWNWHIEYFCEEAQKIVERLKDRLPNEADLVINVPPGTTKSAIWTIMLPAWAWVVDPTLRILSISYSDTVAMKLTMKSRDIIQSDMYRICFPTIQIRKDQNNKSDYENTAKGQRYSAGITGSITSMHFHLILIDDPLNPKEAASEAECATACELIDSTLSSRKVDKAVTATILIMQRLSENDPSAHLLAKQKQGKKIKHISLPAELKDGVKPVELEKYYINELLDPIRLSKSVLHDMLIDLGTSNYAGQFGQRPSPAGGLIWQRWFKEVPDHLWPETKHFMQYGSDWDLAYTKLDANAASAYITAGKIKNNIYIDDLGWDWLEFPELIKYMKTKQAPHYIEAKACFVKGTLVRTDKGLVPIELINEGDYALSFNLESRIPEYKKVLKRFTHALPQHSIKMITFKADRFIIKCTSNHEFYINGSWYNAGTIAGRIMEIRGSNQSEVFDFKHGKIGNYQLQRQVRKRANQIYETRSRRKRLFADNDCNSKQNKYCEDAQVGGTGIYSKPYEPASCSPYQQYSRRQPSGKFRVGNLGRKQQTHCYSRASHWIYKRDEAKEPFQRIEGSQCNIERTSSERNSGKIQTSYLHQKNARRRVRSKYSQHHRCDIWQRLEACELNTAGIKSIELSYETIHTYDLSVQDNHNYCITAYNVIVHNSGKSAKQTLTKNGIPAIEVEIKGGDKIARAKMATPTAEAGLVYIRKSLAEKIYDDPKQGILNFPRGKFKDLADVLAQTLQRLGKKGGFVVSGGSKESLLDEVEFD